MSRSWTEDAPGSLRGGPARFLGLTIGIVAVIALLLAARGRFQRPRAPEPSGGPTAAPGTTVPPSTTRTWTVMGTTAALELWDGPSDPADLMARRVEEVTRSVEAALSTYLPASDISLVNRRAGAPEPVPVGDHALRAVGLALDIGKASGGLFDITIAPLVSLWGFDFPWRGQAVLPPPDGRIEALQPLVDPGAVQLDAAAGTLRLDRPGMRLDLGGIGKGYALDRAAEALVAAAGASGEAGGRSALLRLGGQVLTVGPPPDGASWRLGVSDPRDPDRIRAVITIEEGSLATSGDSERFFLWQGERFAHVLDPRTGRPVRGTASVTVWAREAADADAWSTALMVAGPDEGTRLLSRQPGLGALWIIDPGDGDFTPAHIRTAGTLTGRFELFPDIPR